MIKVTVKLTDTGTPIRHLAENTYTRQGLYCVVKAGKLIRYPIERVLEVIEEHAAHA